MKAINKSIYEYIMITIGVISLGMAIAVFFSAYSMVTGGVTGLAIIIQEVSGKMGRPIPIWLTNIVFNVPLLILGVKVKGFKFLAKTLYATSLLSVVLYFAKYIPPLEIDLTLVAVFGGVLNGAGVGLVFRSMASTGGSDLVASIVNKYHPHWSVQKILFTIDFCVITLGFFTFGPLKAMYAIIAVYISTKVIGAILEGLNFAKAAFIISDKPEEIAKEVMLRLNRGVTALQGKGMYTGGDKNVILCVVSSKEIFTFKEIVNKVDKSAFVIVADVREVLGQGFKEIA